MFKSYDTPQELIDVLRHEVRETRENVKSFCFKLGNNPNEVLRFGFDDLFLNAAKIQVAEEILAAMANAKERQQPLLDRVDLAITTYQGRINDWAQWRGMNTSQTANLSTRAELAATSWMLDRLKGVKRPSTGDTVSAA